MLAPIRGRYPDILGLDLSRNVGWAHWEPGRQPVYGTAEFLHGIERGRLARAFDAWLLGKITGPTEIFYEALLAGQVGKKSVSTALMQYGLVWHLIFRASTMDKVSVYPVDIRDWRKHYLGSSAGTRKVLKAKSIAEGKRRGFNPGTDDAADALGVLDYGAHKLGIPTDWPAREGALM